ncbi:type II toxin-antitoxin system RelE family toxin [Microbacterium sp. No. 7]|uniref:type II toxin-antitoxin system RelE family toxin n=1 Tax=Microbacterium sp. No. 7 TaxID=1714373 RepID=UPI0006CFC377|nr:type II toxin-antitoxin system RelE/ParE family toxin [Microbacterium sp. No. 7]ALJ18537.1 hypothetical protein AOA12_00840 [Microbacterium sp. No. 7]
MSYTVEFSSAASRELRKLDPPIRRRILGAISELEVAPRPSGAKRLVGNEEIWRIRVGDYRVLYRVLDQVVTVRIVRVAHRRAVYENMP